MKGKNSDHTTYRWYHKYLLADSDYFRYGIISISIGHAKGKGTVIREGSVSKLIYALRLYIKEFENEKQ